MEIDENRPVAKLPELEWAFSVQVSLLEPLEQGMIDDGRTRFIPISGGRVWGPRLSGEVLPGGGDWQVIRPGGLVELDARYFLRADDGTVIGIANSGVRCADEEVTDRIARGERVPDDAYYFRTRPIFTVAPGPHEWLRRTVFVGRASKLPDTVAIDFHAVS